MRESKTKDIDGYEVTVQQLGGMRSLKLLHKLTRAIAPAAMQAGGGNILKADLSSLGGAVEGIFDRFSADDLEALVRELFELAQVKVGGKNFPFLTQMDTELAGKPGFLIKAIRFALEVNYQDFFSSLRGVLAEFSATASQSKASTSTPGPQSA